MNIGHVLRHLEPAALDEALAPLRRLGWSTCPLADARQALEPVGLPEPAAVLFEWTEVEDPDLPALCHQRPVVLLARLPSASAATRASMLGAVALVDVRADPGIWASSLPLWIVHHGERRAQAQRDQEHRVAVADARTISAAVGLIAASERVTIDQAFSRLRNTARSQRRRLERVAADTLDGHRQAVARTASS